MMDLTPLEVRKKKGDFRRQIRGYDPDSVDDFLDLVADRLEQLVRENAALTETSGALERRVSENRERERALTEALVSAQQLREEMRAKAVQEADAARSEAERDAQEHRSLAAREAEEARREAREILERARADAAHELEAARRSATAEMERIRGELERIREREGEIIRTLQARRAELLESYRGLLEGQIASLETLRSAAVDVADLPAPARSDTAVGPEAPADGATVPDEPHAGEPEAVAEGAETAPDPADTVPVAEDELPAMSAGLAALVEAAEADVDSAWSAVADPVVEAGGEEEPEWARSPAEPAEAEAADPVEAAADRDVAEPVEAAADRDVADPERTADEAAPAFVEELVLTESDRAEDVGTAEEADLLLEDVEADGTVELVLEEVDEEAAWLSDLATNGSANGSAAARPPAPTANEAAAESDEEFIDSIIAQAGVTPLVAGRAPSGPAPEFLRDLEEEEAVPASEAGEPVVAEGVEAGSEHAGEPVASAGTARANGQDVMKERNGTAPQGPAATAEAVAAGSAGSEDPPADAGDDDEDFGALFGDGDDEPAEFDFDAALANATGFSGFPPERTNDADNAFSLGVELDDPASPLGLDRGTAGAFKLDDVRIPPLRGAFTPSRPSELTVRPLSPEEEAPDLPVESRPRDETDDDMFSTMFRGR